jgi:hypothetical protein
MFLKLHLIEGWLGGIRDEDQICLYVHRCLACFAWTSLVILLFCCSIVDPFIIE